MRLDNFINSNYFKYPILAILPLLVTGPFFPDLILSLSSAIFFLFIIKEKKFVLFKNKIFFYFILFCIICILSSVLSDNIFFSLNSSLFYFRIGIFAFLIKYLLDIDGKLNEKFYYTLFVTFLFLIFDGYIQFFFGKNILQFDMAHARVSSFFGNELILGSFLSRLTPLFFALFILKKRNLFICTLCFSILILIDVLIFISGERTAFFFLNLSILFLIIFVNKFKIIRIVTFVISMLVIFIIIITNDDIKNRMVTSTLNELNIPFFSKSTNQEPEKKADILINHQNFYAIAWRMFLDKPILGHGPKMFRIKCKLKQYNPDYDEIINKNCSTHPHNFYFQILAEVGIFGFFFLLVANYYFIKLLINHIRLRLIKNKNYLTDYQLCLLASILISFWPFSPNGNFFNNWLMIVYSFSFGFLLNSFKGRL